MGRHWISKKFEFPNWRLVGGFLWRFFSSARSLPSHVTRIIMCRPRTDCDFFFFLYFVDSDVFFLLFNSTSMWCVGMRQIDANWKIEWFLFGRRNRCECVALSSNGICIDLQVVKTDCISVTPPTCRSTGHRSHTPPSNTIENRYILFHSYEYTVAM